ncbi:MAG: hypothetical protein AB7Q29_03580 [Vicinamibacterales bacterium]
MGAVRFLGAAGFTVAAGFFAADRFAAGARFLVAGAGFRVVRLATGFLWTARAAALFLGTARDPREAAVGFFGPAADFEPDRAAAVARVEPRVDPFAVLVPPARRSRAVDAFLALLALRLAMLESFRNLDSLAISVVLSDAYR